MNSNKRFSENPVDDIEKVFLTHDEIVKICERIGNEINRDYHGKTPLIIGLLRGCIPFMAELIKHITIKMEYDFMEVESYFGGTHSSHTISIKKDISTDLRGRHILIVDDIIDTGLTLKTICAMLNERGVASTSIITLLDKPEGRNINGINADYVGSIIPKAFVVGFGLDYCQLYRNLPFIGVLKERVYHDE